MFCSNKVKKIIFLKLCQSVSSKHLHLVLSFVLELRHSNLVLQLCVGSSGFECEHRGFALNTYWSWGLGPAVLD